MPRTSRIGEVKLTWGESLRWDDYRDRLYFVDCGTQTLHWLDDAKPPLHSMKMESLPTGVVLTDDGRLVVALDDGLHLVDPDRGTSTLLDPYPAGIGGRANDAGADLDGNLITGTLGLAPGPGSYWWFSAVDGWRQLDDGIGNANGPVVLDHGADQTLVFADTTASTIYSYSYDGKMGTAANRRVLADATTLGGMPDGACVDADGGVWSCVLGRGALMRFAEAGLDEALDAWVELPSDLTFGGPSLDRLYFVSIAVDLGDIRVTSPTAGALMVVEGLDHVGRPEPRFRLA